MAIRILMVTENFERAVVKKGLDYFVMSAATGITGNAFKADAVAPFTKHGFEPCDRIFWEDEEARQFLATKYAEFCKKNGVLMPTHQELRELIKYIDIDNATKYLDSIENELIPSGKYDIAKEITQDLKEVDCVVSDPVVLARVEKILEICSNENI